MWNNLPRELETRIDIREGGLCVSPKISGGIAWLMVGAYSPVTSFDEARGRARPLLDPPR